MKKTLTSLIAVLISVSITADSAMAFSVGNPTPAASSYPFNEEALAQRDILTGTYTPAMCQRLREEAGALRNDPGPWADRERRGNLREQRKKRAVWLSVGLALAGVLLGGGLAFLPQFLKTTPSNVPSSLPRQDATVSQTVDLATHLVSKLTQKNRGQDVRDLQRLIGVLQLQTTRITSSVNSGDVLTVKPDLTTLDATTGKTPSMDAALDPFLWDSYSAIPADDPDKAMIETVLERTLLKEARTLRYVDENMASFIATGHDTLDYSNAMQRSGLLLDNEARVEALRRNPALAEKGYRIIATAVRREEVDDQPEIEDLKRLGITPKKLKVAAARHVALSDFLNDTARVLDLTTASPEGVNKFALRKLILQLIVQRTAGMADDAYHRLPNGLRIVDELMIGKDILRLQGGDPEKFDRLKRSQFQFLFDPKYNFPGQEFNKRADKRRSLWGPGFSGAALTAGFGASVEPSGTGNLILSLLLFTSFELLRRYAVRRLPAHAPIHAMADQNPATSGGSANDARESGKSPDLRSEPPSLPASPALHPMTVNILVIPQVLLLFSAPEIIAKMSKPGFSGLFTSWATPLYFGTAYFALRKLEGFLRSGREGSNNIHWGELALVMGATSLIPSVGLTNTVGEFVIPSLMILTLMVLRDFRLGKDSGSQHEPSRQDSDVMARRGFLMTAAIGGAAALIAKRQAQTLRESKKTIPVTAAMLAKGISLVLATDSPGELLISLIYKTNSRKRVLKILGGWHMPMGGGSVTLQYDRLSFLPKVRLELELKYLPFLGGTNAIRVVGILPLDEELPQRRPPSLRGSPSVPRHSPHEASLAAAA